MQLYTFKSQFISVTKKKVVTKAMIINGVYYNNNPQPITLQ